MARENFEHGGHTFSFTIEPDDSGEAPWTREEGHGPVSDWREASSKRAGEIVLSVDRQSYRFYDMREAQRIARADGWGFAGKSVADHVATGMTHKQVAEKAAQADYERLRAWCRDEWGYVGVIVRLDGPGLVTHHASLWGIESDAGDYLETVKIELADEILSSIKS
jgi:hypothetical protein